MRPRRPGLRRVALMQEFGRRLHHHTPGWVKDGAAFHIRVRLGEAPQPSLTHPPLARELLDAARRYHATGRWWCELFLLMPDHWHAILVFPAEPGMSRTLRDWKRGTARFQHIDWQENYFDHRIRNAAEFAETWHYIRRNPAACGLCEGEDDWPWWCAGGTR